MTPPSAAANQLLPCGATSPTPLQALLTHISNGDLAAMGEGLLALMATDSLGVSPVASLEELEQRRLVHEAVDCALRRHLLAQDSKSDFWRTLLIPLQVGALKHGNVICNAMWLRRSGSSIPDTNEELLEPALLAAHNLEGQAKLLGRFMVANDGVRVVDYAAIAKVLNPALLPAWTDWTLGCHGQSPDAIAQEPVRVNQERTLQGVLEYWEGEPMELAATPTVLCTAYERPYRTAGSTAPVARKVVGELLSKLYWSVGPADITGLHNYPEFAKLRKAELLVFCPNWREKHVIHRCSAPLFEPSRHRSDTHVLLLHEVDQAQLGQCMGTWRDQSLELEMRTKGHYLHNIGVAAEELRSCNIDLLYFPELCPSNPSAWMAMQRVGRVQATGYGFPSTSGSPHMDYFLGGVDVEGDGSDYVEQLVLIPGWGQALVEPPRPERGRVRPERDERVQIATIATSQKLNGELLTTWNEILRGEDNVSLELFPSIPDVSAQIMAPRLSQYFRHGSVELNGWTPREELIDTLVQSDFYLNTFPYGGYNCLVEALACGLPIVTIEGHRARNRTAAALLRRLGLPEFLIAKTVPEYIAAAKRLIRDPGLRVELRQQLSDRESVLETLRDADAPAHFTAALDWMREQGPRNGRKPGPPVLIRAGEAPRVLASR